MNEKQEKIEKLYCLAKDRYHEQDLNQAIVSLKSLLQLDFKHLDAHFFLAQIYQKDQSFELSNQHFRNCLENGYEKLDIHKLLAFNNMQMGLYQEAIYELQKQLHLNKDDADAYAQLADVYLKQQQYHYAKKVLLQAISLDPKTASYYLKLSQILKIGNDLSDALIEVQKAIAIENDYHEAHFEAGTIYSQLGKDEQAVTHYQKAISINNIIPMYYNNLAVSLVNLNRPDEAQLEQKIALALDPQNRHFQNNLSKI